MIIWTKCNVRNIIRWSDNLFTLYLNIKFNDFKPGQYVNLGLKINDRVIYRSYSIVGLPGEYLEFYIEKINNGLISNKLYEITNNNYVYLYKLSKGNLLLDSFLNKELVFLISSGTGISPFLSILSYFVKFKYKSDIKIIFIYLFRYFKDFVYFNKIMRLYTLYRDKLRLVFISSKDIKIFDKKYDIIYLKNKISLDVFKYIIKKINLDVFKYECHYMLCGGYSFVKEIKSIIASFYANHNINDIITSEFF